MFPHDHTIPIPTPTPLENAGSSATLLEFDVGRGTLHDTKQFCRAHRLELWAALLAAFRATHYRMTLVEDAVFATPVCEGETSRLSSTLSFVPAHVDSKTSFGVLARSLSDAVKAAHDTASISTVEVQGIKSFGTALAHTLFVYHSQLHSQLQDDHGPRAGIRLMKLNFTLVTRHPYLSKAGSNSQNHSSKLPRSNEYSTCFVPSYAKTWLSRR
jgi:hypothetical protein